MPIAKVTDHVESGLDLLLEIYKDKPRIAALITADLNRIQELEDAAWDVLISRLIDYATNAQLDVLGKIVGQSRISADDEVYRVRIRARIRANQSLGNPRDVIEVVLLALGVEKETIVYTEHYPASFSIEYLGPVSDEVAGVVRDFIQVSKALGVKPFFLHTESDEADTFAFASGDDFEDDSDRGFGSDDPDSPPGGEWIDVI